MHTCAWAPDRPVEWGPSLGAPPDMHVEWDVEWEQHIRDPKSDPQMRVTFCIEFGAPPAWVTTVGHFVGHYRGSLPWAPPAWVTTGGPPGGHWGATAATTTATSTTTATIAAAAAATAAAMFVSTTTDAGATVLLLLLLLLPLLLLVLQYSYCSYLCTW